MSLTVRRVVTGHDAQGRAVVAADDTLPVHSPRPGLEGCVVWASAVPADNLDPADGALLPMGTGAPEGALFRVVRYGAGLSGRMHRTQSLDYGVVISGSIVLELDDGAQVTLNAGDVLVQRGTIHNWINPGDQPCTIAFVLVASHPLRPQAEA
jgi:quercetin dioxygenase-like cupin family protein